MKLGEALALRARNASQLNDLRGRITNNAVSQEGEEAAENVLRLIEDYISLSNDHAALVHDIAVTNMRTVIGEDTLLMLIHQREALQRARAIHELAAHAGTISARDYRYSRSEIKYVPKVNVAEQRELANALDNQIRALDAQIQGANWVTDLIEG